MNPLEGNIKFSMEWEEKDAGIPADLLEALNRWREILMNLEMIGCTDEGIGYGNLSVRAKDQDGFYITGSATGAIHRLKAEHYSLVTGYRISENRVSCRGYIRASSESLSHAAVYTNRPLIGAVFHVHHKALWKILCGQVPTTSVKHAYGTPELAMEIRKMLKNDTIADQHLIAMGGHEDGIISWGKETDDAGRYLLACYQQL